MSGTPDLYMELLRGAQSNRLYAAAHCRQHMLTLSHSAARSPHLLPRQLWRFSAVALTTVEYPHHLICWDKDADTSERQKGTVSFGKEVPWIDWPSDLSLFTTWAWAELHVLFYLIADLHTPVHVSNDWPGSFFPAVIICSGPCLSSARGVERVWAVWYVHLWGLSLLIVWAMLVCQ